MSKYEITTIRSIDDEVRFVIYNKEERAFFAGYDFMGSVDWEYSNVPSEKCELTAEDDPEQIVRDLESADEPAEPKTDPVIKALQNTLDYARNRRNDEYDALENIRNNGPEFMLDKQVLNYRESQAFYEGVTMAIFAAGYSISTQVGTDYCTVTK